MSAHQYDHGHTVAGWVGFGVAAVGTVLLGAGVCLVSGPLLVAGLVVEVAALLVTWVLHLAGWGKPSGLRPREQWGWRVRDPGAREGHADCLGCRLAGRRPERAAAEAGAGATVAAVADGRRARAATPVRTGEAEPVGAGEG
ncbi:HGxxPAAW family protein [Streptomyces sp. NPDC052701]|uniref:HGxxPAAW family protein n=1 Tax=Streptomyces sp. NPDC052701 TaxID=3155533 RepID=UPI003429B82F